MRARAQSKVKRQNQTGLVTLNARREFPSKSLSRATTRGGRGNARQSCSGCYVDAEKYDALYGRALYRRERGCARAFDNQSFSSDGLI